LFFKSLVRGKERLYTPVEAFNYPDGDKLALRIVIGL